jgi:hypothetical protein
MDFFRKGNFLVSSRTLAADSRKGCIGSELILLSSASKNSKLKIDLNGILWKLQLIFSIFIMVNLILFANRFLLLPDVSIQGYSRIIRFLICIGSSKLFFMELGIKHH